MNRNFTLRLFGLPLVQSLDDLSRVTKLSKFMIYQLSKNANFHYKVYKIPKKNGKLREIAQPSRNLKGFQSWILVEILNKLNVSPNSKGFTKGQSTLDNAKPHVGNNALLTIDIQDFFPTICAKQVFNVFKSIGYNNLLSTIFTRICTFNERLPQGSPCSPKLANLICLNLDNRIQSYVGKKGITYTRYADDMTFSAMSPNKLIKILTTIEKIIKDEDFTLNEEKTRFAGVSNVKKVTGLVITDDSVGIGKKLYKKIRAKFYNFTKITRELTHTEINEAVGWKAYLKSVDKERWERLNSYIVKLKGQKPKSAIVNF